MGHQVSDQVAAFCPLDSYQLQQVSGGCHQCQPQIHTPSSLDAFAPSMHLVHPGGSFAANFQQPADYFHVF